MQPGELIVARLSGGVAIGRFRAVESSRIRMSVGRNKEARIPAERIILATNITASEEAEVEEFRRLSESLASDIDLREVWEVVRDEAGRLSLSDLAELLWGPQHDAAHRVALLLHLDSAPLYFVNDKEIYTARSLESVQEAEARRRREAENASDSETLADHLGRGLLPPDMTRHQTTLVEHLRGYAVHGDNYTRSAMARGLLEGVVSTTGDLQRRSFELLVDVGVFSPDEPLELERAGIPEAFPEDVLAEAASIDPMKALEDPGREDLTDQVTFTIDDAGTLDRDDAISLTVEESRAVAAGGPLPPADHPDDDSTVYSVGIHIADAAALVSPGGATDEEANRRMATLYLPDRKVPMVPPGISDRKGSLLPGERRVALSLLARITASGDVLDWRVTPSVIRSQVALSYEEADGMIEDPSHALHGTLTELRQLTGSLLRARESSGALSIDRPEMSIKVSASGEVSVRVMQRSTPSRMMVTELMILCNSLLAEFCRREELPAPYRSQAIPDIGDVTELVPAGPLRRYLMARRLRPADLSTVPGPHGGLGVPVYIQATSPLRRYHDMVMQRQIGHFLATGQTLYSTDTITSVAQRADVQIREMARMEEDRRRYWFLKYLKQRIAAQDVDEGVDLLDAVVLEGQSRRPALLELADYPYRFRAQLPEGQAPGDTVTLRLHGVDLWQRVGQFVHVVG